MLVVSHLLTQRSSCIGRLQLEKHVSLFVQALNVTYFVVRDVNRYVHDERSFNLSLYSLDGTSYIGISQPKNTHISLNMKPSSWLT